MGCCRGPRTVTALRRKGLHREARQVERILTAEEGWEDKPEGWDRGSMKDFWDSLTGDREHKITQCIKKMKGKVDDPGAYCGSLARKVGYKPG